MSKETQVAVTRLAGGTIARVCLSGDKGNILSRAAVASLTRAFTEIGADRHVKAVVLAADGPSFCYGASVPEHAPGEVDRMLPEFCALFRTIAQTSLPVAAAVRGRCLGGGLELALAATRLVVAEDSVLGLPEVTLGVFPPVAPVLLHFRTRQPVIDRMVVLGESISGVEAVALGVADSCAPAAEVEPKALAWAERYRDLSGVAVRYATRAARIGWNEALAGRLDRLEKMYLVDLMATADAKEGITAFLERRSPRWTDQ